MNIKELEIAIIIEVLKDKGYKVFNNFSTYNVNIGGIRSKDSTPNVFNDLIYCFYRDNSKKLILNLWDATTDPGLYWLKNPSNVKGTAILVPGQYKGVFALDYHNGKYLALCQRLGEVSVYRDINRDNQYDLSSYTIDTGFFGINIHRASKWNKLFHVGKYSAGCQVFQKPADFREFMTICNIAAKKYGNSFTYTLLEEKDFKL